MAWETRPWATCPNDQVMRATKGGRYLGKRVSIMLDPRSFDADDANDLRVEGEYLACSSNGPLLVLDTITVPLIDVLVIQEYHDD